ncbi:MAG: hypothetical protein IH944_13795 [Armatimonadetes bacterium]|nr:hypothetical protein [Armatimonadota bacterium]
MPEPPAPAAVSADTAMMGPPILPIKRIKLYSSEQWEELVLEWANGAAAKYDRVERCGGAGDMGRDVIGFPEKDNHDLWDNYQCKHYDHPLHPSDIWLELGKLVYYAHRGEFTYPRAYSFVAPQGAGTALANLLRKPEELRRGLITNWDRKCKEGITSTGEVKLEGDLRAYLDGLDFSIFSYIPPLQLVTEHRETSWHLARFGGALPERQEAQDPPATPEANEVVYLRKLFAAYSEHLEREVLEHSDIADEEGIDGHYQDSRIEFYSAESLRSLSRDSLPVGEYEKLQDEVHHGVRDEIRRDHVDGFECVRLVVKASRELQLTSHALLPRMNIKDRGGICHQLANDRNDVVWVKP